MRLWQVRFLGLEAAQKRIATQSVTEAIASTLGTILRQKISFDKLIMPRVNYFFRERMFVLRTQHATSETSHEPLFIDTLSELKF